MWVMVPTGSPICGVLPHEAQYALCKEEFMNSSTIQPHNLTAARIWNAGGGAYDRLSAMVVDAIEHCVLRLDPQPGERVLDVATGTSWAARRVAARGTTVIGIDIAADLIAAATAAAAEAGVQADFRVADAENFRTRITVPMPLFRPLESCLSALLRRPPPNSPAYVVRAAGLAW
jgi:SAM-dependent methyltransferase